MLDIQYLASSIQHPASRPNRLPLFVTFKVTMIQKPQRQLLSPLVVHEERMHHGQHAEVAGAAQLRALDRDDGIIVPRNQRVVTFVVSLTAGQDAEVELG